MDGRTATGHHGGQEFDETGEQETMLILILLDLVKKSIDLGGGKGLFKAGTGHDRHGTLIQERLQKCIENHREFLQIPQTEILA